jgi:MFS family permease
VGTLVALAATSAPLLFGSAVVTGFGFGAAFLGAIATITAGVAPGHRAGLLAAVFVVGYLAFSIPAIAAGIAAGHAGLTRTTEVYGAAVVVLALVAVAALLRARRRVGSLAAAGQTADERDDRLAPAQLPG